MKAVAPSEALRERSGEHHTCKYWSSNTSGKPSEAVVLSLYIIGMVGVDGRDETLVSNKGAADG